MKIYSKGGILLSEVADEPYTGAFMGERFISCNVKSEKPIDFLPEDYMDFRGERFVLDYTPTAKKISSAGSVGDAFQYDLKFVSLKHELEKCLSLDVVLNDNNIHYTGLSDVQVFGDAKVLADRILANLNRIYKGENQWTIEVLKQTDTQNISLSDSNCWDAVSLFKSLFNLNFTVTGRNIKVGTVGKLVDHVFKYGSGNGLTEIVRTAVDGDAVVTRLKAYGGNRNLPRDYNKTGNVPESQYITNLMLPGYTETLIDYVDSDNIPIYGIREAVFKDEEIYPSISGMTAEELKAAGVATSATGRLDEIVACRKIEDDNQATFDVWIKDIGFDIKKYLTPTTALISMRDGNLGGYEFEITNVVTDSTHAGAKYKLTLNRNQDDNFILPDIKTYIKPGDHFVLLEIYMPDVYVKAAEQRLLTKAKEYLAEYDHVKATYSINMDRVFMAYHPTIGDTIYEGDLIRVVDEDLKLDREIIIQNLTIKTGGAVPEYEVTLSDNPVATTLDRVQDNIAEIERNTTINRVSATKEARRKAIELQLLESNIFDPDGSVSELILRSMFLKIGADSMNYQMVNTKYLNGVPSNMNFTNTSIYLGKDDLIHFSYGAAQEQASTWHIEVPFSTNNLDPDKIYFVAVKASKDNLSAEWVISNSSYITEYFDGYYVFNFGILYNVIDGKRIFTETRGMIASYGSSVIAGRFTTMDGYSYWDMENGNFQMYNKKTGQGLQFKDGVLTLGSFNPETGKFSSSISKIENDITETSQQAADAQKAADEAKRGVQESQEYIAGTILPNIESIQAQVDGQVNSWFYAYSPTLANYPASSWDTVAKKDAAIGDTFTNTQEFIDNTSTPDAGKSWRWVKEGATYKWTPIADSDAVKALLKASQAEATADGKSTIHLLKPSVYGVGDAWILESDTVKPPYKKGEMLSAVMGNTAFNAADWEKRDLSADNAVDNLQIGGVNYLNNSRCDTLNDWGLGEGTARIVNDAKFGNVVEYTRTSGSGNFQRGFTLDGNELSNTEVVYFVIAKQISSGGGWYFGGWNNTFTKLAATTRTKIDLGNGWFNYWTTFKSESSINTGGTFGINSMMGVWQVYSCGVLKGNKPTSSWSPSLTDQQAEIERISQLKAEAERVKAESYADGIVTEEEQRAIADAQAKYDAAVLEAQKKSLGASWVSGKILYDDPTFEKGINGVNTYNNSGNDNVIVTRTTRLPDSPFPSGYNIQIKNIGESQPGWGGFSFQNQSRANAIFICRFIAKIPYGYTVSFASNRIGPDSVAGSFWATPQSGSGKWEEYIYVVKCGASGVFHSTNFYYLEWGVGGTPSSPVSWYLAYASVFDVTDGVNAQTEAIKAQDTANDAKSDAVKAIRDAVNAQSQSNTAIENAQKAENEAKLAKEKADVAKSASDAALIEAKKALISAENFNFLKSAFGDITSEQYGGVQLLGFIGVKDRNNAVVAGIAGAIPIGQTKYPMIFAGAINAVGANNAKFRVYEDGSLYATGADITGRIIATSGEFTGKITSNASGNVIEIDPENRRLLMRNAENSSVSQFRFSANDVMLDMMTMSQYGTYNTTITSSTILMSKVVPNKLSSRIGPGILEIEDNEENPVIRVVFKGLRHVSNTSGWDRMLVNLKTGEVAYG